jgi:hypothetical protein
LEFAAIPTKLGEEISMKNQMEEKMRHSVMICKRSENHPTFCEILVTEA